MKICSQPTIFAGISDMWVPWECLLELGSWMKQGGEMKFVGENLCDLLEKRPEREGGSIRQSITELLIRQIWVGGWVMIG